ncbi:hypothetical protein K432DRAFT_379407 [Lepidopterella palustris CBS 459.81]|uniref:Signal recognition particle subunit SRP72 n=1 Tax=Lepidopterella palustris CBS 459.81 TaxID=1314670 RepID=A0A8E2EGH1_9PEZI|nr:hypothetical protein K432DRAFT_379407 [Lepidopterella palustris CBS 459.81]
MAATKSAATNSLSALLRQTTLDDHEEFLKAANAELKKSKTDLEAQHVKVVALLNLERYDDVLKLFEDGGDGLKERAKLEYAYALYRAGRPDEAVNIAENTESGGRGMKHVLAQAAYRAENFEQAAEVYRQLSGKRAAMENEVNDLIINSGAVDAQLEWAGLGHLAHKKKPMKEDMEAFETAYNAACGSISRGELGQGEVLLQRSKDLCNALEDLTEVEKMAELLPIIVQQIYVLIQLGKIDEAVKLCTDLPFAEIRELSTRHLAYVNSIAASKFHPNPYLAHRLFHSTPKPPNTDQHFSFQSAILRQNEYVLELLSQKYTGLANSTETYILSQLYPTTSATTNSIAVLNAAANAHNATGKAALKAILPIFEKRPNDVGVLLTIIHLYILTNNHGAAVSLLESFFERLDEGGTESELDVRFAPGLIGTLVSLYSLQGRKSHSRSELAKAANYWSQHESRNVPKALLKAAGTALLEGHTPEDLSKAAEIFASLHEQDPTDPTAIAGLVAAYATTNPSKLNSQLIDSLPPVSRLVSKIEAAALEDAGVAIPLAIATIENKKRPAADKVKPAKAKKVRTSRMPKDFDPQKKMDPERWLPMRDRSYYRPKGRKGKQRVAGLTQGGEVKEEKEKVAEIKTGGAGGGGQAKKKKGKGKGKGW